MRSKTARCHARGGTGVAAPHVVIMKPAMLAVAVAVGLAIGGCAGTVTVAEPEVSAAYPVDTYGYTPLYYEDQIVYYDEIGAPFYMVGANVHYVPRTYVHYDTLVRHYHAHRPAYQRWYDAHPPRRLDRHHRYDRYESFERPPRAPQRTRYTPPRQPVRHEVRPPPPQHRVSPPPPARRVAPPPPRRVSPPSHR